MTFRDFLEAVKSTWSAASNAAVLVTIMGGAGLSALVGQVPTLAAMAACLVAYMTGFLIACFRAGSNGTKESVEKPEEARAPSGKLNTNMSAVGTLPPATVAAAVAAFDSRSPIELGRYEEAVRESIASKDGIFALDLLWFNGCPGEETGKFALAKEWRGFMDDADVLNAMRERAERWEASQEKGPEWQEI